MASFKEAFAAARKAQGAGGTFTWKGKSYSTNLEGEKGTKKKTSFSTEMVEKAIDKASGIQTPTASTPRPQPRPTEISKGIDVSDGGITVSKLPKDPTPTTSGIQNYDKNLAEARERRAKTQGMKSGGVVKMKEGSAKDTREDKVLAKKAGMSMKTWEKSAADKKHDAPKKMAGGGIVKMKKGGTTTTSEGLKGLALRVGNEKATASLKQRSLYNDKGKSGRDFAAKQDDARMKGLTATHNQSKDLIERYGTDAPKARGFMAYEGQSGTTKKQSGGVVKKAGGGSMRGAGAAVRGKGFSGCY